MALLELDHVSKQYSTDGEPVIALRDFSMAAAAGEMIAIVGRSGCGKSTLLNLCGAMDLPTSGSVAINGVSTTLLNDAALTLLRREKVGFVFQSFQLLHTLTVIENVELPLLLARRPNARERAMERLCWVELEGYANRLPHQLSGGQQQRVAIARALVNGPHLLLADEPTGNLDTTTAATVLSVLRRTASGLGTTILIATHSLESASITDRVIHLRDGVLDEVAAPALGRT